MEQKDAKLIQRVLQGDPDAFAPLVKKYQKGVHALVWRKIGDFHTAQEITQDAFLNAYQKLSTLKNPNLFAGWLYVIASNLCLDWLRKNRLPMESLDTENTSEVDKVSYSQYIVEKQETEADETRREIVKELLQKLPESERTVMTLHYLGEMTIKTISEFLGVSPNTVKSRLNRARNRLRQEEDVIRESLGSFQLPNQFAENIMQEVWRATPIQPPVSKPMVPLALSAASAVLIFLLIGVGSQYLSRFQRPYSLDATSEPTVELIEAVFVLDSPAKPAVRNQPGRSVLPGRNLGAGQQPDDSRFATAPLDTPAVATPKPQWTQTKGPEGGRVNSLFAAANGGLYARIGTDLYRLTDDRSTWVPTNTNLSTKGAWRMVEHEGTLYTVSGTEILASVDRGETWNALGAPPEGELIDIVLTEEAFYLALVDGVFRSVDAGRSWTSLNDENLSDRKIQAITAIENTVFVGTDAGLYRWNSEGWQRLSVGGSESIRAVASAGHRLYVAVGAAVKRANLSISISISMSSISNPALSLYRSTDLGDSWQAIDFEKTVSEGNGKFSVTVGVNNAKMDDDSAVEMEKATTVKMVAAQKKVFVLDGANGYYSSDAGETWRSLDSHPITIADISTLVISDANTFYRSGHFGVQRTTDAGKTWHPFNTGLVRTSVEHLFYVHNALYGKIWQKLVVSFDGGESWAPVLRHPEILTGMMKFDDVLYVKGIKATSPQIFRVSAEDNGVTPVPGVPSLAAPDFKTRIGEKFTNALQKPVQDDPKNNSAEGTELKPEYFDIDSLSTLANKTIAEGIVAFIHAYFGGFAVSGSTYYMEYQQRLFRWKPGMTEWFDTGLADEGESPHSLSDLEDQGAINFKIAVSGETVYVGKRDGHLLQSFDEGDTWSDVTTGLPFSVTQFKAIAFAGSTLYAATDKGVTYSTDGVHWHTATDAEGMPLVIEKLAIEGTRVYGQSEQQVYQFAENSGIWRAVTPEIPVPVTALTVDGNVLYVGTSGAGVLRFTLDESN